MRRTAVWEILIGASVGLLGGCAAAPETNRQAPQATAGNSTNGCQRVFGQCSEPVPCEVTVQLRPDANNTCQVTSLLPPDPRNVPMDRHRIRVCVNDPVTWTFDNQCDDELQLEIGNFHVDQPIIDERRKQGHDVTKESRDPVPFEGLTSVRVSARQRGAIKAIAKINYDARTYKYAILEKTRGTLLDPEGEIYR